MCQMTEDDISVDELISSAIRKKLQTHLLGIVVSVGLIIITALLVCFYPKIEGNKRLLFLISSIWPSGVIVVLVPVWIELARDLRDNIGRDIDRLLQEEVEKRFADSPSQADILSLLEEHREEIRCADKVTRKNVLKDVVERINGELQRQ